MTNTTDTGHQPERVDLETDATTVTEDRTVLIGVHVQESLSAHACPLKNGSGGTTLFTIPANTSAGQWLEGGGMRFDDGIYVDPDNAGDGVITVVHKTFA